MRHRRVIEPAVLAVTALGLALSCSVGSAEETRTCVPGADRRWVCGTESEMRERTRDLPVQLPAPPPAPLPPVLLIDPERLLGPMADEARGPADDAGIADAARADASPAGGPAAEAATPASANRPAGSHVWQLARASSPAGFAALLRARGIDPDDTRTLQTRRGDWLLLYGDFADIDSARAARRVAGDGFARAWREIEAER